MDAGNPAGYTSSAGVVWQADQYYDAGSGASGFTTVAPENASNPVIYMTERWCANGYHLPIANGSYRLRLFFDEINPASGTRVFDVAAENLTILSGLNITVSAGGINRAMSRTFAVTVKDRSLDITFTRHQNCPSISAIAVLPAA
ncbi:MAG: malectin domain-containing carbohydrate-binding protein [Pseudonocardiales bacterium]